MYGSQNILGHSIPNEDAAVVSGSATRASRHGLVRKICLAVAGLVFLGRLVAGADSVGLSSAEGGEALFVGGDVLGEVGDVAIVALLL